MYDTEDQPLPTMPKPKWLCAQSDCDGVHHYYVNVAVQEIAS